MQDRQKKARHVYSSKVLSAARAAVLAGLLLTFGRLPVARACLDGQFDSVHFNSGQPDFGTPPRRGLLRWWGELDDRPTRGEDLPAERGWVELDESRDRSQHQARGQQQVELVASAQTYEKASQWSRARKIYQRAGDLYVWTGNIRDRVEVLQHVEGLKKPLSTAFVGALRLYLQGMAFDDLEQRDQAQESFAHVSQDSAAGFLREHALYQQASIAYEWRDFPRAVDLYQQLLRAFPNTVKREAALIMIARCALLPQTAAGRRMEAGKQALAQLEREFPHTRFHASLMGLQGRVHFLEQRYSEAFWCYCVRGDTPSAEIVYRAMPPEQQNGARVMLLATYLHQLARAQDYDTYAFAIKGIDQTRKALSPTEAARFNRVLLREPDLPAPYFYYRLYHCKNKAGDLRSLTHLADTLITTHPATHLSPLVRVRLAEVYYQQRQYTRALRWADRAVTPRPFDRALYVRGATEHKLKHYHAALADFNALLDTCPNSPLRHAAREELALLYEAVGDRSGALEQYFALDYKNDIAFLLDARMSPPEIENYLTHHRHTYPYVFTSWNSSGNQYSNHYTQQELIAYTLGIRYMREEKWRQAEYWLRRVPHAAYTVFNQGRHDWASKPSPDPLVAIRELRKLQRAVAHAHTDNARAMALFRYGSYYSTHGTLLLYNPPLWNSGREFGFQFCWNPKSATREDEAAVRTHMYQHEVYVHARRICLEVARRYPHAPVAPQALYRAACAARYLANFNTWWDEENKHHNSWDESIRLMRTVARRYPRHPLAAHARKYANVFKEERTEHWEKTTTASLPPDPTLLTASGRVP